jgi:hypothetical protein
MGYNARNDEIRDNVTRMRREWSSGMRSAATDQRPLHRGVIGGGLLVQL